MHIVYNLGYSKLAKINIFPPCLFKNVAIVAVKTGYDFIPGMIKTSVLTLKPCEFVIKGKENLSINHYWVGFEMVMKPGKVLCCIFLFAFLALTVHKT